VPESASSASADGTSNGDDGDQIFEVAEVTGVACVEPGAVRVGRGGDEQIDDPWPGLTAGVSDRSRKPAIADRDCLVDRQRIEVLLQDGQSSQALGTDCGGLGDKDAEVQLCQGYGADRETPAMGATPSAMTTLVSRMARSGGSIGSVTAQP
jgi:hypothetical protein